MQYISSHEDGNADSLSAIATTISKGNDFFWTSTVVVVGLTLVYWYFAAGRKPDNDAAKGRNADGDDAEIPWAPGALPLLGHALSYRKNPSEFLVRTRRMCGTIFRLNLAGRQMILVCGPEEQRQLARLPDSVLSLRKAIADIGFEQTLGYKNVYQGTQIHKGIVKAIWNNKDDESPADRQLMEWRNVIREAMEVELLTRGDNTGTGKTTIDFFHVIRRIMLRAAVEMYIGKAFLRGWTTYDFLQEFTEFQDAIEDVTAKAAVLPKWFSLMAMLWPLQRRREALQRVVAERLEGVLKQNLSLGNEAKNDCHHGDIGFWLREILSQKIPISDVAEFIVGLLFAAHKNPAIGAAQTYLLLQEHGSKEVRARCRKEAIELVATTTPFKWSRFRTSLPTLRRACLESLRLTAHSIGGVRTAQKDVTVFVKGAGDRKDVHYKVPKGSSVGFAHTTSSLDSSIWGNDAASFDSDLSRYPNELYTDNYKFTTFSNGTHECPGRSLAMIQLQVTIAFLLTEYDVTLPEKIPALDFERATLAQREEPVMVSIVRRELTTLKLIST
mmetsp:Transcript_2603/g.5647  ORF Transcript_2603/g.5647 Transcript_2603/m.5647 type:complete len:556 (-) Transcript_2603:240-1907(-)